MDKLVDAIRSRLHASPAVNLDGTGNGFSSTGDPQQLSAAISAGRSVRRAVDSFATAQHTTVQQLLRWASREPNAAIRDVVHQISELDFMWLESQTDFKTDLADFERTLTRIVEIEEQSVTCVTKAKKETKFGTKGRQLLGNVQNGQVSATTNHEAIVQATLRESEVQKLLHLKKSLSGLAKAYVKLGEHCSIIFEAQRRIATLLPDAEASISECPQLSDVRYEGVEASRALVAAARAKLAKSNASRNKQCACRCGGRRHRSTSRVKRRCSEPVPQVPDSGSDNDFEDGDADDDSLRIPEVPAQIPPPPYIYASAPPAVDQELNVISTKLEEVMTVSSTRPLYPPIPVQTSSWSVAPPPYLSSQRR